MSSKEEKLAMRKRWVEALRSGKYEQGRECLRRGDKYCCMGVLLDLLDPDNWSESYSLMYGHSLASGHGDPFGVSMPGADARACVGLAYRQAQSLAELNDEACYSFTRIAEVIENMPVSVDGPDDAEKTP